MLCPILPKYKPLRLLLRGRPLLFNKILKRQLITRAARERRFINSRHHMATFKVLSDDVVQDSPHSLLTRYRQKSCSVGLDKVARVAARDFYNRNRQKTAPRLGLMMVGWGGTTQLR